MSELMERGRLSWNCDLLEVGAAGAGLSLSLLWVEGGVKARRKL
jgi:hypothetical protein